MTAEITPLAQQATPTAPFAPGGGRIGIVDIGSNSVRLVVYDAPARLPVPVFNERATCQLGKGLGRTGRLNADGIDLALATLGRFTALAREMAVERFVLLGTAALRDASDGARFVAEVKRRFGLAVKVLSGEEEARLGALGVLAGLPEADGLFLDMGGGSLDLVVLEKGRFGASTTLPLGHLRLAEDAERRVSRAKKMVDEKLAELDWLSGIAGRTVYAAGGAMRAIARVSIEQTDYPLHVLDNYTLGLGAARELTKLLAGLGTQSLEKLSGVANRRADTLPFAAMCLNRLLKAARPARVAFSGYGLREGQLFQLLPSTMKREDPLVSVCEGFARRSGRFSAHGEELVDWIGPLFPDQDAKGRRLHLAAALLSDIGWPEHADYRALHAFLRVLRLPIAGLEHRERILLATAIFVRYGGKRKQYEVNQVRAVLAEADQHWAAITGLALRLAHLLSGGVAGLLPRTRLELADDGLILHLPAERDLFASAAAERLFDELAQALGVPGRTA